MRLSHELYKYTRIVIFYAMMAVFIFGWIKSYAIGHTIDLAMPGERLATDPRLKPPQTETEVLQKDQQKIVDKHTEEEKRRKKEEERKRKEEEKKKPKKNKK